MQPGLRSSQAGGCGQQVGNVAAANSGKKKGRNYKIKKEATTTHLGTTNKAAKICVYFVIFEIFVAWQIFSLAAFPHRDSQRSPKNRGWGMASTQEKKSVLDYESLKDLLDKFVFKARSSKNSSLSIYSLVLRKFNPSFIYLFKLNIIFSLCIGNI